MMTQEITLAIVACVRPLSQEVLLFGEFTIPLEGKSEYVTFIDQDFLLVSK